ncbi:helix-turn-helix domain-containing protein, partial [Tepidiforma sp.]|uniref:helix-turn-helix domain-containing protein n=1 Tax=Tepidiforma sp. TaxID=2682230 RepID=UPI002ADDA9D1
ERIARRQRTALPAWAIDRLAACNAPSVRLLLGAVNQAIALQRAARLDLASLDTAVARIAISQAAGRDPDAELLERIARHFQVDLSALTGSSRSATLTPARAVAVALLQRQGRSLSRIGELLGGRHKSTISDLARRGARILAEQPDLPGRLSA